MIGKEMKEKINKVGERNILKEGCGCGFAYLAFLQYMVIIWSTGFDLSRNSFEKGWNESK